jgi:Sigma-70 region 2
LPDTGRPVPRTDHALSAPRLPRLIFIRPCSAQQHLFPGDMNPGARRAPALRAAAGPEPSPGRVTSRNPPVFWTSTHPDIAAPPQRLKPMSNEPSVTDLMARARNRDKQARDALVERYAALIWSICRRHRRRLDGADDVGQSVWLQPVDQLDKARDPAALPGWLATTTRRERARVLRAVHGPHAARHAQDAETIPATRLGWPKAATRGGAPGGAVRGSPAVTASSAGRRRRRGPGRHDHPGEVVLVAALTIIGRAGRGPAARPGGGSASRLGR